jgi:cupin fold WbuC family metalloprotein
MNVFYEKTLNVLNESAGSDSRLRQHLNIHESFQEPCQRLFNAVHVGSYIQPHRHLLDSKKELLLAVKGKFAIIEFSHIGGFKSFTIFGSEKYCHSEDSSYGVEIPTECWHTVIALVEGSVLLEVKQGPFIPDSAKEIASWAPSVGSSAVDDYVCSLYAYCGFGS